MYFKTVVYNHLRKWCGGNFVIKEKNVFNIALYKAVINNCLRMSLGGNIVITIN